MPPTEHENDGDWRAALGPDSGPPDAAIEAWHDEHMWLPGAGRWVERPEPDEL